MITSYKMIILIPIKDWQVIRVITNNATYEVDCHGQKDIYWCALKAVLDHNK